MRSHQQSGTCKNIFFLLKKHFCSKLCNEQVVSPIHVSAGRKRGDLRIYLTSPQGTRSTLLDARPQDYSSSGYIDWPFMTTHSWGENPNGRWVLEIHNDAYSKWAANAKFFKWSLELYGIEFDPNSSSRDDSSSQNKYNVVREAPSESILPTLAAKTTTTSTALPPMTTTTTSEAEYVPRGCVSKRSQCTQSVEDCRTFQHRSVASVFCQCSSICLEVASTSDESFNMQCLANNDANARSLQTASEDLPFYCQLIPF